MCPYLCSASTGGILSSMTKWSRIQDGPCSILDRKGAIRTCKLRRGPTASIVRITSHVCLVYTGSACASYTASYYSVSLDWVQDTQLWKSEIGFVDYTMHRNIVVFLIPYSLILNLRTRNSITILALSSARKSLEKTMVILSSITTELLASPYLILICLVIRCLSVREGTKLLHKCRVLLGVFSDPTCILLNCCAQRGCFSTDHAVAQLYRRRCNSSRFIYPRASRVVLQVVKSELLHSMLYHLLSPQYTRRYMLLVYP